MKKVYLFSSIFVVVLATVLGWLVFFVRPFVILGRKQSYTGPYQFAAPWNKTMYDGFYERKETIPSFRGPVRGGIVPHHLLAGHFPATFFDRVTKDKPSVIVLLSPNHFSRGQSCIGTTMQDWQTVYGVQSTDRTRLKQIMRETPVSVNENMMKEEHGVYGLVPFVRRSLPRTTLLSFAFRQDCATSTLDSFIQTLTHVLPKDAVVVASIDFSHYQTGPVADFHDAYSIGVIKQFDYSRLQQLEIDSAQSLYVLMKSMEARGAERVAYDLHTNGARLAHNQIEENITSYYTPFFVDGPKANVGVVSLLSFGDVMLDRGVEEHIQKKGVDSILGQLAGDENRFFQGMDVISVNLEGPFARVRTPTSKSIAFRFDPAYIPFLTVRNISLVSLANNHGHDMGASGVEETHILLRDAGIDAVGDQYTVSSSSLIMKTIGDRKMAWIAVNDVEVTLNATSTLALIAQAKQNGATVIINVHWGTEYMLVSNTRQRLLAHQFIDVGADVIVGHHPHVVEEIEIYKDRAIFYSLGNFVFDQYFSRETQQGLGVGMVFGSTSTLFYLFPVQSTASEARQMRGRELNKFATGLIDRSRLGSYTIDKSTLSFSLPYGK